MDDFILLHRDPEVLKGWKKEIIHYLAERLKLSLKDPSINPKSVYRGIDFLGYFIKPRYSLIRRRVVKNGNRALATLLPPERREIEDLSFQEFHASVGEWQKVQSSINSYVSHYKHASAYNLKQSYIDRLRSFQSVLEIGKESIKIRRSLTRFESYRFQIEHFIKFFPEALLLIRIGKFYELHGSGMLEIAKANRINPGNRGGLPNYGVRAGKEGYYRLVSYLKANRIHFVIIDESDDVSAKIKTRIPVLEVRPIPKKEPSSEPYKLEIKQNQYLLPLQEKS